MALTERERFDRFVEKHGPVMADAFFWCSGTRWESRRYCAVILARKDTLAAAVEVRGDTPRELAKHMRGVGYAARANVVRRLCEAAPRSPKPQTFRSASKAKRAVTPAASEAP